MRKVFILVSMLFMFIPISAIADENSERVIITFHDAIDQTFIDDQRIDVHHIFENYNSISATIPATLKKQLAQLDTVKMIEDDPVITTNMQRVSWGIGSVLARESHASGFTGKGVKIGVLDTGIYMNHPDLVIAGGVSMIDSSRTYNDEDGHGTHVAGIIGALDNGIGTIGVAPDAEIYAIKVIDTTGFGNHSDVVKGIEWAINNQLDIINLSITTTQNSMIMERILQEAYQRGIIIVAAAGNSDIPLPNYIDVLYPGRLPSAIAVGSIDRSNEKSLFSYFGQSLEFVAPGERIYSTYIPIGDNPLYAFADGTSMATPFVAGVAALYKEAYPHLKNTEIRSLMQKGALDLGSVGKDPLFGYGLIQAPNRVNMPTFPDVKKGAWYEVAITELYNDGIVTGYENGYFYPNRQVTRAEAITMIGKALNLDGTKQATSYKDVPANHFASGYITNATKQSIIIGFPNNEFKPNAPIIRGDVAVMLAKAFSVEARPVKPFIDVNEGNYYDHAIHLLKGANITTGYPDGTYRPKGNITRAEFATMLSNIRTSIIDES